MAISQLHMTMEGRSIAGRRHENQDSILSFRPTPDTFFLAVADGMGGAAGGQVASQGVINLAYHYLRDELGSSTGPLELKAVLSEVYRRCHQLIREKARLEPSLEGLGTTLTCVLGQGNRFVVGNLGDSRSYLMRGSVLRQLTTDHTYIAELQSSPEFQNLDPDFISAYSHVVTKTLDGNDDPPDLFPNDIPAYSLKSGDLLVLCSDGLVPDKSAGSDWLKQQLEGRNGRLDAISEQLIQYAYEVGSEDNISVVLAKVDSDHPGEQILNRNDHFARMAEGTPTLQSRLPDAVREDGLVPSLSTDPTRPYKIIIAGLLICILGLLTYMALNGLGWLPGLTDSTVSDLIASQPEEQRVPQFTYADTLATDPIRYTFVFAKDSLMTIPLFEKTTMQPSLPLESVPEITPGTYFWQVIIQTGDHELIIPSSRITLSDSSGSGED